MLSTNIKSGSIIRYTTEYGDGARVLLLSDLCQISDLYFKADVFWLNEYWYKQEEAMFTTPECWELLC